MSFRVSVCFDCGAYAPIMRSGGRVAMSASIRREEMAFTFCIHGVDVGSNMMPTPADSCFRVAFLPFLPFPLPFAV